MEQFVRAIRATRGVDDDSATEMEDEGDEYLRQDAQARAHAAKLKADEGDKEKKRERKVEKANVRAKLSAWADECLRWRNGYEAESELGAFPWRSYKYLREKNLPTTGLCHRFHVHTGRAAQTTTGRDARSPPARARASSSATPRSRRRRWAARARATRSRRATSGARSPSECTESCARVLL